MLDVARFTLLQIAIALAIRQRFWVGLACGLVLTVMFVAVGACTGIALANRSVGGEHAAALLCIGPTTLPLQDIGWLPMIEQTGLVGVSAIPAFVALERGLRLGALSVGRRWADMTTFFLALFGANMLIMIGAVLTAAVLWLE